MNPREKAREFCEMTKHTWKDTYYGVECLDCGLFYPDGCEPWLDFGDVDDGEPEYALDKIEWYEECRD